MKNIFAYTEYTAAPYPPYLSINRQADGRFTIAVREPAKPDRYGASAEMTLPEDEVNKLLAALTNHVRSRPPLWYQVMPNGDVITSDGLPRQLIAEHQAIALANAVKAGRQVMFRKPTPEEEASTIWTGE